MLSSNTSAVSGDATYVEDVFSTYLYNGTGASGNVISNGVDLSTKGGLVWLKQRSGTATSHTLMDTARGTSFLSTNNTNANNAFSVLSSFNTNGFTIGQGTVNNVSGQTYASWTFRKQPKFFDVVTYTGNGSGYGRSISHSLGSIPGCVIIKATSTATASSWASWHRGNGSTNVVGLALNETSAALTTGSYSSGITSTEVLLNNVTNPNGDLYNENGVTYVMYLFAHDAGGFGLTGTDNVISCGSFTTNGSGNATVNLGYEPQWFLAKSSSTTQDWFVVDSMRGWVNGGANDNDALLRPNLSNAEFVTNFGEPTATGYNLTGFSASQTYIYIAIRRGPMKVPTDATKVFQPSTTTGANEILSTLEAGDLGIFKKATDASTYPNWLWGDRLRGFASSTSQLLSSNNTSAESTWSGSGDGVTAYYGNIGSSAGNGKIKGGGAGGADTPTLYSFRRAPSFFDEVCYTGTGSTRTISHNLQAVPELILFKKRSGAEVWCVYNATIGPTKSLVLNATSKEQNGAGAVRFNDTAPTSSVFTVASDGEVNGSGATYVAYLFATCAGVSKVGSYTGTGATQTISCGFAGGARFVLVKRTDFAGDWYVWDTARGMVSGTDPSLLLNSTAAEVNANSIYTTTGGFQIVSTAAGINTSGGTYIFLAIA